MIRNVVFDPFLLPGGGATEMAIAQELARAGPLEVAPPPTHPLPAPPSPLPPPPARKLPSQSLEQPQEPWRSAQGRVALTFAVAAAAAAAAQMTGVQQWPFISLGKALEVIPRTLAQNCGANVIRQMTVLRAKHRTLEESSWGIDGNTGALSDMKELGILEPYNVKVQTLKTSIEAACMILRIDDIVSGMKKS